MSLKGTYVRESDSGPVGMIETAEPDENGYVIVYYGSQDKKSVRRQCLAELLIPLGPDEIPTNPRINGEIPVGMAEE